MSWLEPPLKLPDAVNIILDALRERVLFCFGDNYYTPPNVALPAKKLLYYLRPYNEVTERMDWIRDTVHNLFRLVLIAPEHSMAMTKAYPYADDPAGSIRTILEENGINPAPFLDQRPYLASAREFYEAAYFLINNYLTYAIDLNVICESTINHTVYLDDEKTVLEEDTDAVTTSDMREIARCEYRVTTGIDNYGYYSVKKLLNSKLKCTKKENYSEPAHTLNGEWKLQKTVVLKDCRDQPSGIRTLANYPQVFTFDGDSAVAPTLAASYVDDIAWYSTFERGDKWLREYFQYSKHFAGGGSWYYHWLDAADTLVSVNRDNFPDYKYYDG